MDMADYATALVVCMSLLDATPEDLAKDHTEKVCEECGILLIAGPSSTELDKHLKTVYACNNCAPKMIADKANEGQIDVSEAFAKMEEKVRNVPDSVINPRGIDLSDCPFDNTSVLYKWALTTYAACQAAPNVDKAREERAFGVAFGIATMLLPEAMVDEDGPVPEMADVVANYIDADSRRILYFKDATPEERLQVAKSLHMLVNLNLGGPSATH